MGRSRWRSRWLTIVMAFILMPLLTLTTHAAPAPATKAQTLSPWILPPSAPSTKQQTSGDFVSSDSVLFETEGTLDTGDQTFNDGSLFDVHPFAGEAGQTITIRMMSHAFDTYLQVIDATDQTLGENDDATPLETNSSLTITLSATGTYRIIASAFDATGRGEYRVVVSPASAADIQRSDADRLLELGFQQHENSEFQAALQSFQQALEIYQTLGDRLRETETLLQLGTVYFSMGQSRQAIDLLQNSLAVAQAIGYPQAAVYATGSLGVAYDSLGQYQQALRFRQQSLILAREIDDRFGQLSALINLGNAHNYLGQSQQAIHFHQQALDLARAVGDRQIESNVLGNLGRAYSYLEQPQQAAELHQQALAIALDINDPQAESRALGDLAEAYYALGQYQDALAVYQQTLAIVRDMSDRQAESHLLRNLGNTYEALGQYQNAIEVQQEALAIVRTIGDRRNEALALDVLGNAYESLGQYQRAIELYEQSLTIDREIGYRQGEAISLNNMGVAFINTNQWADAETALTQSIEVLELLRTDLPDAQLISIADTQAFAYVSLERALTAQGKTAEALEVTERARARAFALQLARRFLTTHPPAEGISSEGIDPPTVAEIQQIARNQNATLVTYSLIFDQALYIWVIQPSGEIAFRSVEFDGMGQIPNPIAAIDGPVYRSTPDPSALNTLVTDSRAGIGVVGGIPSEPLQDLHQVLIEPIAALLPADPTSTVVFIPQGSLFLVPFAALQAADGTHLIEQHTIMTAPSIQVLDLATRAGPLGSRQAFSQEDNPLVVGNPVMPRVWIPNGGELQEIQLTPLPGAEAEALAIGDFLDVSPLIGSQATEAQIKQQLPNASLIHLATHGLLEYGNPQTSGVLDLPGAVALTAGVGEDGLLTAAEILEMDLHAELAVLSACDTGRGRITGDGVVGLSRAFITTGVPSVIVSLWAVPDAPTATLMAEFYRQLQQGQPKVQALRQAMLATLQTDPAPVNWAAFTLIGAAE